MLCNLLLSLFKSRFVPCSLETPFAPQAKTARTGNKSGASDKSM